MPLQELKSVSIKALLGLQVNIYYFHRNREKKNYKYSSVMFGKKFYITTGDITQGDICLALLKVKHYKHRCFVAI